MRSTLGHITVSSFSSILNVPASRAVPLRVTQIISVVNPWVCQQCCYSYNNQYILWPRAATSASTFNYDRTAFVKKPRAREAWLSTTSKRPTNDDGAQSSRKDLPSQEEGRRSQVSKRFSHVMDHLQSNVFIAGQRLNDLTGYSGIEALKKDIEEQGQSDLDL